MHQIQKGYKPAKNSVTKKYQLIQACRAIVALCSEVKTKHINALCGQKVKFFDVKTDGT
jgi:hypothetical protein